MQINEETKMLLRLFSFLLFICLFSFSFPLPILQQIVEKAIERDEFSEKCDEVLLASLLTDLMLTEKALAYGFETEELKQIEKHGIETSLVATVNGLTRYVVFPSNNKHLPPLPSFVDAYPDTITEAYYQVGRVG